MKSWTKNGLMLAGVLITCSSFAAEKTAFVRASHIKGARITYQAGGEAGTIQDIALDPNTGCARFVMIESGGHVIAAPFRILRPSGEDSYTVTVDKERLMSAPVVNVDRVEEWSNPSFVDRVYSYYGESPSETNISVNEREGRGHGEHGYEERGQAERGQTEHGAGARGQAERGQQRGQASPAPVGEQNQGRGQRATSGESPQAQGSPSAAKARSRAHGQSSPSSERSATRAGSSASPSRETMPSHSPGQRNAQPGQSPRSSERAPSGTQHRGSAAGAERSPSSAASPNSGQ